MDRQESVNLSPDQTTRKQQFRSRRIPVIAGGILVTVGIILLLDQYIDTGWLPLLILPSAGLILLREGIRDRLLSFALTGVLFFAVGLGGFFAFSHLFNFNVVQQIGIILLVFGLGWAGVAGVSIWLLNRSAWWALIPAAVFSAVGYILAFTAIQFFDFVLYVVTAVGVALLIWGIISRLFGLIIPGSLLIGIGPGIYLAWGRAIESNGLAQTGIMLVTFSLGWGLIILFSRVITDKFIWWPLIPGGVLAMVGWGLYLGGDPENAAAFITNTGSIGLIIFGLYLLFMRRGIHH